VHILQPNIETPLNMIQQGPKPALALHTQNMLEL